MSAPRTSNPSRASPDELYASQHEALSVGLAETRQFVKGLSEDLHELGARTNSLETEMRRGFTAIGTDMAKMSADFTREAHRIAQPKGVQWQMVSVCVAICLALATWANSYFGQGIAGAAKSAQEAQIAHAALSDRIDDIGARQHADAVAAARTEGYQTAAATAAQKERDRLRSELDDQSKRAKE